VETETSTNQPAIAIEGEAWIPEDEMWEKLGLPSKNALRKRRERESLPDNVECRKSGKSWVYRLV
jgi:hypothetical protein